MSIPEAAGLGQSRDNNDFKRGAQELVTGRRSKTERDGEEVDAAEIGLFHELLSEVTDSLIYGAKKNAKQSKREVDGLLRIQAGSREQKQLASRGKKLDNARGGLIDAIYLKQQYKSPRCWMTEEVAFSTFEQLNTKKARLAAVKEQILIRYLGLGWVDAHHPWSKDGHTYSATELLEHFVQVVLPLAETEVEPDEAPLELPGLPRSMCKLGTRAQDCIDLEQSLGSEERVFRLQALKKRESLQNNGFGDELEQMQQHLWPLEKLRAGKFKIDKLFEYKEEDEYVLQWCQGNVTKFISEKEEKHVIVEVKWNGDCLSENDPRSTREILMRTKWNPNKPADGAWREDLHDKILNIS